MFNSNRYLTSGVQSEIPLELQLFMWECIDKLNIKKDYLQIFRISHNNSELTITHEQEQPEYKQTYALAFPTKINQKVYVIDDGDHCTMLLAEEY